MVDERLGTGKSYPSLPIRESRKENSGRPTINVQMDQMNTQLTQLIGHLQRLNHQIQSFQEEKKISHISNVLQIKSEKNAENNNLLTRKAQLTEKTLKSFGRRKGPSRYINGIRVFFLVIGSIASLLAAILLFFRGPVMM